MANAITPGKYRAKAKAHQWGRAKTGTELVRVEFEFTSGTVAGQSIYWDGFFTEKTQERTLESLEACGWDGASLKDLKGLGTKEVELVVELEKGNDGNEYAKVKWVNGLNRRAVQQELDAGSLSNLEQRMKGLMLQRQQKRQQVQEKEPYDGPPDDFDPDQYADMGDEPPV
jgi:hypothetical protein